MHYCLPLKEITFKIQSNELYILNANLSDFCLEGSLVVNNKRSSTVLLSCVTDNQSDSFPLET